MLREASPLFASLLIPTMLKERGRDFREGRSPLKLPSSVVAGSLERLVTLKLHNLVVVESFREGPLFLNTLV